MKYILLIAILLLLSACSARDYHYAALNETVVSSKQLYHIQKLKELGVNANTYKRAKSSQQTCYTYPPALGGFTTGCRPKVKIR